MRKTVQMAAVAFAMTAAAACSGGEGGGAAWGGEVLDSAGIQVVMNPTTGLWGDTPGWTLEEVFRVGGLEADATAQFALVVGIDADDAGRVYVGDQQTREIHVYEPDGSPVMTIGSPGEGPGEFGPAMAGVFVSETQIRAPDVTNQRVNLFTLEGEPDGSIPFFLTGGVPIRWDEMDDGRLVTQLRGIAVEGMTEHAEGDPIIAFRPGEEAPDTLTFLPKGMSTEFVENGLPRITIFAPEPNWDMGPGNRLATAMTSEYRIHTGEAGQLDRIIVMSSDPQPVTEGDQRRLRSLMRGLMLDQGAPPPVVDEMMNNLAFAENYPAFAQMIVGPNNTLWVQQIQNLGELAEEEEFDPQDLGSSRWHVFDGEGRFLGEITMPDGFQPYRLVGEILYGVERDEFDVPSVVGFRLAAR